MATRSATVNEATAVSDTLVLDVQLSGNERKAIERLLKDGKDKFEVLKQAQLAVKIRKNGDKK